MKKLYFLLFTILISAASFGQTFFSENMGTPGSTTAINSYTGWENTSPIVFSGDGDVRTSAASNGYTGASGSGNVFLTSTTGKNLQIDGIDTSAYLVADIQLSFGYLTNSTGTQLVLEQSTNGTDWTAITFAQNPNTSWNLVTIADGQIPSSATLSLRFTQPATAQMRIDDVKLTSVSSSCPLTLSAATASCDATTLALDSYSVTIPYTGGGTNTYIITTSGTVSGDNPSSVAAGDIIVTFTEGSSYDVNIAGGTCNLDVSGNSPECKPINTLPYYEGFDYTDGSALGNQQMWTNVNSGDEILATTGSLSYTGLTPIGNSVVFDGAGIDCFSPLTTISSGTVYYSFLLNISSMAGVTNANGGYFAGFGSNTTTLGGTLWAIRVDDSTYELGIEVRTGTSTNTTFTSNNYATGVTHLVVVAYRFNGATTDDDTVDLFVDPTVGAVEPTSTISDFHAATDLSDISYFFLRQDSTSETGSLQIDELKITTTWSEATLSTKKQNIENFKIYPNPTSLGYVNISSKSNSKLDVSVFDVLGKQVIKETVNDNVLNVSKLNSGIYIMKVSQDDATTTQKLVIK
jgi:hypothetical protein